MPECQGGDKCLECGLDICDTIYMVRMESIMKVFAGEITEDESREQMAIRFPGKTEEG